MSLLPDRPDLEHLRKQAKALLRRYRAGEPDAVARFAASLPGAARRAAGSPWQLHDAQSCIAREYGFASWADLRLHVEAAAFARGQVGDQPGDQIGDETRRWLRLAYGGDVTGSFDAARPHLAAALWAPGRFGDDASVACAAGDLGGIKRAIAADSGWVGRPAGPLALPPLLAVTLSQLGRLPAFRAGLRACARTLLDAGADPNGRIFNRFPPASLAAPDPNGPLSALYGAAGVVRDPAMADMLLQAGADPNDGESLYHSLEDPACTRLLLQAGARVAGTNALRRALDMPDADALELLLAHGADPNEPPGAGPTARWGSPLLRAIALRCSARHIEALLAAGADPFARTPDGLGAYRLAQQLGLDAVADRLRAAGAAEPLTAVDAFIAACSRGELDRARRLRVPVPADRLRLLPDAAAWGAPAAVQTMVACGWPIDARGGDWDATALNHAVMRGDPALAAILLAAGASWRETHGYGSDVLGTLSWASLNEPTHTVAEPDWPGCARALQAAGLPPVAPDPSDPDRLVIDGRSLRFSGEVTEALLAR